VEWKPVAGYFRISQARDEMHAPDIYRDQIERYCDYRGLRLARVFSDIDHSAYRGSEKRPALRELVERRREFSAVVVPQLSRFGRSLKHLSQLFDVFDRDGISLVFLDLGMDTSTSQGRLLRNIMAAFAEYESDVKGDYTRANTRYATIQGRPFGGIAPFGYIRRDKTYEIHPKQSEVVRFVFKRYAEGASQSRIARELAERGSLTMGGTLWRPDKVGRMLDNPAYASLMVLDGEFVPGRWEPLVDPSTWHRIAQRRKQTRERWSRPRAPKRLLAGLIYCGDCGRRAYYTARGGGLPGRYRCAKNEGVAICGTGGINATRAERYVITAFLERARYYLLRGEARTFIAERQWELANAQERRMLLAAAIHRVVILPLEPGQQHPGRAGRGLSIEWKAKPSIVAAPPARKGIKGTGRPHELARAQLRAIRAEREERGSRARSYYREWKAWRTRWELPG
jgi:site-specific DNA recombinase